MRAWLAAVLLVGACGGKDFGSGDPDAPPGGSDGTTTGSDGSAGDGWTTLISRTWSLPTPGGQTNRCARIQVPADMWITGFRSLAPVGTHHAVLTIDPQDSQTGNYDCTAIDGTLSAQMMYASGENTGELLFPSGVAIHLAAGSWINLNLHLFNATDLPLADTSGVQVKTVAAADVVHEADMTFGGTQTINIPPDGQPHTAGGGCIAPADWHLLALWPHMHQYATHQTFVVTHSGVPTTMLDTPYLLTEQKNYPMPEQLIHKGDQVQVTCTYVNNSGGPIGYSDSTTGEMCFTGMYKYPAGGGVMGCVN